MQIIKFNKSDIEHYMDRKLKLPQQIAESFEYVEKILIPQKVNKFSEADWYDTKNYDWCCIGVDNVTLLIRKYGNHFTIFSRLNIIRDIPFVKSYYSIFTYYTEIDKLNTDSDKDSRIDNPFIDIDESFDKIIDLIKSRNVALLWNDLIFKRPDYVEVKLAWVGSVELNLLDSSNYYSIDLFNFTCQELSTLVMKLYAENDMVDKLKVLAEFDLSCFPHITVNEKVKDGYFHDTGITFKEHGEDKFSDVYSLTMYCFDEVELILDGVRLYNANI